MTNPLDNGMKAIRGGGGNELSEQERAALAAAASPEGDAEFTEDFKRTLGLGPDEGHPVPPAAKVAVALIATLPAEAAGYLSSLTQKDRSIFVHCYETTVSEFEEMFMLYQATAHQMMSARASVKGDQVTMLQVLKQLHELVGTLPAETYMTIHYYEGSKIPWSGTSTFHRMLRRLPLVCGIGSIKGKDVLYDDLGFGEMALLAKAFRLARQNGMTEWTGYIEKDSVGRWKHRSLAARLLAERLMDSRKRGVLTSEEAKATFSTVFGDTYPEFFARIS